MSKHEVFPPTILMIRPVRFEYNAETAVNNAFQIAPDAVAQPVDTQVKALTEFDHFVEKLEELDIPVLVVEDTMEPHTPDSIFPNNWITTHADNRLVLYPMFARNRRLERKESVLSALRERFHTGDVIDFSPYEEQERFLEGTGSFILDRPQKIAYACLSPRTDEAVFQEFCERLGYEPVSFKASDSRGIPIYHTNVMMCVGDQYAVINLQSIHEEDRPKVEGKLTASGKTVVDISQDQMDAFAGNMLQIFNRSGEPYLVMSTQAYNSLSSEQIAQLEQFNPIVHVAIDTIEQNGGGSARCMMAELYLEAKSLNS